MAKDVIGEVLSSPTSIRIASLVSARPRTQSELAELTGVSVPAVLKHLRRLEEHGLVMAEKVNDPSITARRVYLARGQLIGDYSTPGMRVVRAWGGLLPGQSSGMSLQELESLAEDALFQKGRIREQVRKMGRLIDNLLENQAKLAQVVNASKMSLGERLVLQVIFTEEDIKEVERILSRHYGLPQSRRSIDRVILEAKRLAKK